MKKPRKKKPSKPGRRGTRGSVRGRAKTAKSAVETAEKYAQILELRKQGKSLQQIADELGYAGPSGVHQALTRAIERTVSEPAEDVRVLELLRLDRLFEKAWKKIEADDLSTADLVLRLMARRAKLLGMDAPTHSKVELQENFQGMPDEEVVAKAIDSILSKGERTAILLEKMKARGYKVTAPKENRDEEDSCT